MDTPYKHLPVELWLQIISLAASHARKDEFAENAEPYEGFPRDSSTLFTQMEQREESILLSTRLALALVCKTWHPIGIELLWSHLRLIFNKSPNPSQQTLETLQEKPYLGTLVKRLTIRAQRAPQNGRQERENSNNSMICSILKYLPHVNVLTYPSTYSIPDRLTRPSVAIVHKGCNKTNPATSINHPTNYGHFQHAWHHARVLSINLSMILLPCATIVSFPRLEVLSITLDTAYLMGYVTQYWSMPSLRFLSILGGCELDCSPLLRSASSTLEYVQLDMRVYRSNLWPNRVELPKLTSLYISLVHGSYGGNSTITTTLGRIRAPELRCLGVYDVTLGNPSSSELVKQLDATIKAYSSLKEIYLEGCMKLIGTDGSITTLDIDSLCRKGIQVKVRSGMGAWTTYGRQG